MIYRAKRVLEIENKLSDQAFGLTTAVKVKVKSLSHLALCDPMDCSLPCSSVLGIFQARVLEWVAISFARGSSRPRDWTQVFRIVGRRFTVWATREVRGRTKKGPLTRLSFITLTVFSGIVSDVEGMWVALVCFCVNILHFTFIGSSLDVRCVTKLP